MSQNGWIAVDFDGTLAVYPCDFPEVGPPIVPMVDRVKGWIAEGQDVRIFTARVHDGRNDPAWAASVAEHGHTPDSWIADQRGKIENFCIAQFGVPLPITCEKDFLMIQLWDDRCVQLAPNTGEPLSLMLAKRVVEAVRSTLTVDFD